MNCMSDAQKMDNFDEIKKNISRFKKKFRVFCFFLINPLKKGQNEKWTPPLLRKKTAATPPFCKQNFIQTFQIWEMNFLFKVALSSALLALWTAGYSPRRQNFFGVSEWDFPYRKLG